MSSQTTVGRSFHTKGKHVMLDKYMGALTGTASTSTMPIDSIVYLGLTEGDGVPPAQGAFDRDTSPGITIRHAEWAQSHGLAAYTLLCEDAFQTFSRLTETVDGRAVLLKIDSRTLTIPTIENELGMCINRRTAVVLNSDPNSMTQWAIPETLIADLREWTSWVTLVTTMGCNPSGIKRMDFEGKRELWYDQLQSLIDGIPSHHDLLLVRVQRDADQWAYAFVAPKKWRGRLEGIAHDGMRAMNRKADMTWWRANRAEFRRQADILFKTAKERAK